jgi:hypothetical protein
MAPKNDFQAYKSFIGGRGKNMNGKEMSYLRWERGDDLGLVLGGGRSHIQQK